MSMLFSQYFFVSLQSNCLNNFGCNKVIKNLHGGLKNNCFFFVRP